MSKVLYLKYVIIDSMKIIIPTVLINYIIKIYVPFNHKLIEVITLSILSIITTLCLTYQWGIDKNMQGLIKGKVKALLRKNYLHIL